MLIDHFTIFFTDVIVSGAAARVAGLQVVDATICRYSESVTGCNLPTSTRAPVNDKLPFTCFNAGRLATCGRKNSSVQLNGNSIN